MKNLEDCSVDIHSVLSVCDGWFGVNGLCACARHARDTRILARAAGRGDAVGMLELHAERLAGEEPTTALALNLIAQKIRALPP